VEIQKTVCYSNSDIYNFRRLSRYNNVANYITGKLNFFNLLILYPDLIKEIESEKTKYMSED